MKVKELIKKLNELDENEEVHIPKFLNDYLRRTEFRPIFSIGEILVSKNNRNSLYLIDGELSDNEPTTTIYSLDFI